MDWRQNEVFPEIFRAINILTDTGRDKWVSHEDIVSYLFSNQLLSRNPYQVSNMVAWFSQKITEYELGILSPRSKCYELIQNAFRSFERKRIGKVYSYRKRSHDRPSKIHMSFKNSKHLRQERFRLFVDYLKECKIEPELFRRLTVLWWESIGNEIPNEEVTR